MEPHKTCRGVCGEPRPLTHFRRNSRSFDGLESVCKTCRSIGDRRQKLRKRYGITPEQFNLMRSRQGGRCAICREPEVLRLEVDHCHGTGKVRGLLCGLCNRALGLLRENPFLIARAAVYVAQQQEIEHASMDARPSQDAQG